MKRFFLTIVLIVNALWFASAQIPQGFSYQAVAHSSNGSIIANSNVSLRISLLQSSISGTMVYQETFSTTTDAFGIINLNIGTGNVSNGNFGNINWGTGPYFVKIELDAAGGNNYQLMGTSQLMSVPYALYAGKSGSTLANPSIAQYTQAQIDSLTPTAGLLVFNTDYQQLQYFNGTQWIASSAAFKCTPQANQSSLLLNYSSLSDSLVLSGTPPAPGVNGIWTVISGSGGVFLDATKYNTTFIGTPFTTYTLQWSLYSKCDTTKSTTTVTLNSFTVGYNNYTMMVSATDNASNVVWANPIFPYDTLSAGANSMDGSVNTDLIVNKLGADGGVMYAAKVCNSLNLGGYTDWYLPSVSEMTAILNLPNSYSVFTNSFHNARYWTSTESNGRNAFADFFGTINFQNPLQKANTINVRCVRKM